MTAEVALPLNHALSSPTNNGNNNNNPTTPNGHHNMATRTARAVGGGGRKDPPTLMTSRQQMLVQNNSQPSFRVQALVGRHGHQSANMNNDSMLSITNCHSNNNSPKMQRSVRSLGSAGGMLRVPRQLSSRRLMQGSSRSLNASANWMQDSMLSGTSMVSLFPEFGSNSHRILDICPSADGLFHPNSNNNNTTNNNGNGTTTAVQHQHQQQHDDSMMLWDAGSVLGGATTASCATTSSGAHPWFQQSVKFRANNFVVSRDETLEAHYQVGDLLGEGGFGEVYRCTHIESGEQRAVKVIPKHDSDEENVKVIAEFHTVKDLDHPNILRLYALYESDQYFFLVTDLYAGGELYDELESYGKLSEDDAALLMNHMLSCLNYCHQKKLAHRDLKPENVLLTENKNFEDLKVIDFGLAVVGDVFTEMEGSTYYMSPQVIGRRYNHKCDIWSCGVIAYVCIAGFAPFDGDEEPDVVRSILCGKVDFEDPAWDGVSEDAMDFISYLLTYEEEHRPTAAEALQHPWLQRIRRRQNVTCAERRGSARQSLGNLQKFQANSKLKQCVCSLIASQLLNKREKAEIDTVFRSLDHDCDGKLTRKDVETSYKEFFGAALSQDELDSMFEQVNMSGSGAIEYSEFVMASLMEKNLIDDFKLMAAFKIFDKEKKGYISAENLKDVLDLEDDMEGYILNVIVRQVDENGDGKISFDEFKDMMFSNAVIPPKPSSHRRSARSTPRHSSNTARGGGNGTTTNHSRTTSGSSANNSLRVPSVGRSNLSSCSSTISVDSFSMASSVGAIEEDLYEDDSVARKEREEKERRRRRDDDDMSVGSFAHVLYMFDEKRGPTGKQQQF